MEAIIFHYFQQMPARPYNRILGWYLLRGDKVTCQKLKKAKEFQKHKKSKKFKKK